MVGTVIDPELRDEVRVTVIVTGLGRKSAGIKLVDNTRADSAPRMDGSIDYHNLDKPAVMRRNHTPTPSIAQTAQKQPIMDASQELDYLDIPAFLRRKEEVDA